MKLLCIAFTLLICVQAAIVKPVVNINKNHMRSLEQTRFGVRIPNDKTPEYIKNLAWDHVVTEKVYDEILVKALNVLQEKGELPMEITVQNRTVFMIGRKETGLNYEFDIFVSDKQGDEFKVRIGTFYEVKAKGQPGQIGQIVSNVQKFYYRNLWPAIKTPVLVLTEGQSIAGFKAAIFMNNLPLLDQIFAHGVKTTIYTKPVSHTLYKIHFNKHSINFSFKAKLLNAHGNAEDADVSISFEQGGLVPGKLGPVTKTVRFIGRHAEGSIIEDTPYTFKNTTKLTYNPVKTLLNNALTKEILAMGEKEASKPQNAFKGTDEAEYDLNSNEVKHVTIDEKHIRYELDAYIHLVHSKSNRHVHITYLVDPRNLKITKGEVKVEIEK